MTVPTSYTEATLADYMVLELASSGLSLAVDASSLAEAVNTTLLKYGVTDIADANDMKKLRALAKVEAWSYALATVAEEMFERVKENYRIALKDALLYSPIYSIGVGEVTYSQDPYTRINWGDL